MIKATVDKDKIELSFEGKKIDIMAESIFLVHGLYDALKKIPNGEESAQLFCKAMEDGIYKGSKSGEENDKAEKNEAADFLRKFVDALNR